MYSADQLTVIFGTAIPSRQIRLYVTSHGEVSMEDIKATFAVYGRSRVCNFIQCLQRRGFVKKTDGGTVVATDKVCETGSSADRAWRAAKIKQEFTIEDITKTAGVNRAYAQRLLAWWCDAGYMTKTASQTWHTPGVYRMHPDAPATRPAVNKDSYKEKKNEK